VARAHGFGGGGVAIDCGNQSQQSINETFTRRARDVATRVRAG